MRVNKKAILAGLREMYPDAGGALIGWHLLSGLYYIGYLLLTGATL